ncbi:ATP-binding protein [Actinomadura livida]|uniref:DNA-binding CsgD family transcriptional regulator n=1 Tax=Actinomadura livida TaxID=79909 RepID=A0A7W7IIQ7_9ACTN|nr:MULTISPECIES: helix-turn-helix transcriptional regulator [Actinomadura]MBB4777721.1 DNA-binding CsgD family transcriptional regulator [Actinomadura catellatispora]GGT99175.1 transcriptional regulator [Actinomadura livida]
MLVGRDRERERVAGLLEGARGGRSGTVVIRGEAGIGKTALLDQIASDAGDMGLVRGAGIEAETELAFSGLHLMLHPYGDRFAGLPAQQAAALRSAFGLAEGPAGDRFLIGAATLTLLSELASDRPLLCLVDDAQWLDGASLDALLFAARRLGADPISMIFTVRDTARPFPDHGLDVLRLAGLDRAAARELVAAHAPALTVPVRERLLDEAAGNPLALIELANALGSEPARHAGPLPVGGRVQETFRRQLAALPDTARRLLLVVAADGTGDLGVVLRAAKALGLGPADLEPAEEAGLVVLDGADVRFRHPLIRAVTYQDAAHHRRLAVHDALAGALGGDEHADRRAWHLAAAATGPDEGAAAELERAAERAGRRGGTAAVAAAYERAARLSTDPEGKARRLVHAARAAYDAGRPDHATRLAAEAAHHTREDAVIAEAAFIRAQVAYERVSPAADAELALEGAGLIAGSDPEQAVSMLTEAVWSARDAGAHDLVRRSVELLRTVRLPPGSAKAPVTGGLIAYGRLIEGAPDAVPPIRALVQAALAGKVEDFVERVIAGYVGLLVAEDRAATTLLERMAADVRAEGAIGWLPYVLEPLAIGRLLLGDLHGADSAAAEGISLAADIGMDMQVTALRCVAVRLESDPDRTRTEGPGVLRHAELHPANAALAAWGLGLLDLAGGHADAALVHLDAVCSGPARRDLLIRAIPDHAEAAVRAGRPELARVHLPAYEAWAAATSRTAMVSRCRALLAGGNDADEHYRTALSLHGDHAYDAARTRLLYGEWLRRRRRRTEARTELAAAEDAFTRVGATAWAERARTELEVLGDRPAARAGDSDPMKRLTPQEMQVVRLAAAGLSNREIAAQLYLSPRTVGHHLYKAYPKLGVTRRAELARLVPVT